MRRSENRADHGLSLIELVVAMAIFALVAVMGTQALTGMMRMRDGLTARSEQTAALAQAVSLLRADLAAMMPMLFYPPARATPRSALVFSGAPGTRTLALSRSGGFGPDQIPPIGLQTGLGLQRAEWHLRGGRLSRRIWPALMPARASAQSPALPVLEGVRDLRLRSYWEGPGWIDGPRPAAFGTDRPDQAATDEDAAAGAAELYSDTLPLAVELVIDTVEFGTITLVETLK